MNKEIHNGVIWITGFSASGKTTVSRKVRSILCSKGIQTVYLDGDDLRSIFGNHWGFDKESRVELAYIYFRFCSHLSSQGYVVIISAIAMFDDLRKWVYENISNSMQVFLDVPEEERLGRDSRTKKLFIRSALNDDYYDIPKNADLTISNYGDVSPDEAAAEIVDAFILRKEQAMDYGRAPHWKSYYEQNIAPITPSSYAALVLSQLNKGDKLLEVGCGNGRDVAFFSSNEINVTAIDRSPAAIKYCVENYNQLSAVFHEGLVSDLVNTNTQNKFDVVYSRFVIHALPIEEEVELISAVAELLKSGGLFYVECRSINDPLARKGEILSSTERIDGHYRRFIVLDDFIGRLKTVGFKIIDQLESDGLARFKGSDPVVIRVTAEKN